MKKVKKKQLEEIRLRRDEFLQVARACKEITDVQKIKEKYGFNVLKDYSYIEVQIEKFILDISEGFKDEEEYIYKVGFLSGQIYSRFDSILMSANENLELHNKVQQLSLAKNNLLVYLKHLK